MNESAGAGGGAVFRQPGACARRGVCGYYNRNPSSLLPLDMTAPIYSRRRQRAALLALCLLAAGCASTPPTTPPPAQDHTAQVVEYALSLEGSPYAYGKASPEEGFDCSGLVWHVYRRHGVPLPRTTEQMARSLPEVDPQDRRPGDLLFFNTGGKPYSHVALYLGNESFIHAPSSKTGRVMVSALKQNYWKQRLAGVRRPIVETR